MLLANDKEKILNEMNIWYYPVLSLVGWILLNSAEN